MTREYCKITPDIVDDLRSILPNDLIQLDKETLQAYGQDESEKQNYSPELLVFPRNTKQISDLIKYCNQHLIPVIARGGGTGLSGGIIPIYGGIMLSMEKMNQIIEIDTNNLQITVEAGLITQKLQEAVLEKGLFYPPDPSSKGSCMIGGNIAENAGGTTAVKYGVTKDYVLNLEVVLPNGDTIWTGANTLKNVTGYNLTQLFLGSEGTLGVITKVVLKLIPRPNQSVVLFAPFHSASAATKAVTTILTAGIVPAALEFMEIEAIKYTLNYLKEDLSQAIDNKTQAHLLIELDGNKESLLMEEAEQIFELLKEFECGEVLIATSSSAKEKFKKVRASIGEAVTTENEYKKLDTVVPRAQLPNQLEGVKIIEEKYGFKMLCFGHAGDGNMHVNILKGAKTKEDWLNNINNCIREIFELTVSLGGTITAEHGIGLTQQAYIGIALSKENIELQKSIKKLFDPNNILNPGKIF